MTEVSAWRQQDWATAYQDGSNQWMQLEDGQTAHDPPGSGNAGAHFGGNSATVNLADGYGSWIDAPAPAPVAYVTVGYTEYGDPICAPVNGFQAVVAPTAVASEPTQPGYATVGYTEYGDPICAPVPAVAPAPLPICPLPNSQGSASAYGAAYPASAPAPLPAVVPSPLPVPMYPVSFVQDEGPLYMSVNAAPAPTPASAPAPAPSAEWVSQWVIGAVSESATVPAPVPAIAAASAPASNNVASAAWSSDSGEPVANDGEPVADAASWQTDYAGGGSGGGFGYEPNQIAADSPEGNWFDGTQTDAWPEVDDSFSPVEFGSEGSEDGDGDDTSAGTDRARESSGAPAGGSQSQQIVITGSRPRTGNGTGIVSFSIYPAGYEPVAGVEGVWPVGELVIAAREIATLPAELAPKLADGRAGAGIPYRDQAGQVFYKTFDADGKFVGLISAPVVLRLPEVTALRIAAVAEAGLALELAFGPPQLKAVAQATLYASAGLAGVWWLSQNANDLLSPDSVDAGRTALGSESNHRCAGGA